MPNLLHSLKVNEMSLVDRPANSEVDSKTGKKVPRATVALWKRDADDVAKWSVNQGREGGKWKAGAGVGKDQHAAENASTKDAHEAAAKHHRERALDPETRPSAAQAHQLAMEAHQKAAESPSKDNSSNARRTSQSAGFISKGGASADEQEFRRLIKADGPWNAEDEVCKALVGGGEDGVCKDGACQTQGGKCYPASDYAYVPDATKPSTWKLRMTSTPGGTPDVGIVGAAAAALGPGGFRGKRVSLPDASRETVRDKVRAAWCKANPDKSEDDMPDGIKKGEDMDIKEMADRIEKQDTKIAELVIANKALETENDVVMKMTKKERKAFGGMTPEKRKAYFAADAEKRKAMMDEADKEACKQDAVAAMDPVAKAAYDKAGPAEQIVLLGAAVEKARKEKDAADGDSEDAKNKKKKAKSGAKPDDADPDGDGDVDEDEPDAKEMMKRDAAATINVRKVAALEDRVAKAESELAIVKKKEKIARFTKMAEDACPHLSGDPVKKGGEFMDLADAVGEDSPVFKSFVANQREADKIIATQYGEIGKHGGGTAINAERMLEQKAQDITKRDRITLGKAMELAMDENPELCKAISDGYARRQ